MLPEDRPLIDERYARAVEADSLEVSADRRGDVDLLIAAGWVRESLGTALYRLRTEFDQVRGALRITRDALPYWDELRTVADREAAAALKRWHPPLRYPDREIYEARRMTDEAQAFATTALALTLNELKTLRDTRQALGRFAEKLAARDHWDAAPTTITRVAGRVLELWLDPKCPRCEGRGYNGGFTAPMELCQLPPHGCGGSGRRSAELWNTVRGEQFGRHLLAEIERKCDIVDGLMRAYLSGVPANQALIRKARVADGDETMTHDEAMRALRQRLVELRSSESERD